MRSLFAVVFALLVAACGSLLGLEDRQLDGDYPSGGYQGCRQGNCGECSLDYHECRCQGRTTDVCYRDTASSQNGTGFAGCDWSGQGSCKQCPTEFTLCMCQNKGQSSRCGNPEEDPVQRCREFFGVGDLCAQCVCGNCGNEIAGCLEDAGCSALLECINTEMCSFDDGAADSCFDGGPCASVQDDAGGPSGRGMTLLKNARSCIEGPASSCQCGDDPGNCCQGNNPCNLAGNGNCDCPAQPWDATDCVVGCCNPNNSCGLSGNRICECPDQTWDQNDCQNGDGVRCGDAICYSTNVPFSAGLVRACCPPSNPDACGLDIAMVLSTWPGDGCAETNSPGVESDECPPGEPLQLPGQPVGQELSGCCTPAGECGVMVNTGGFIPLGCHVNYPTIDPKPATCDPDGIICDIDCNNCPNCQSQCRCKVERYGFRFADFGKECMDACADCEAGEDMCSGCSDEFGECMCTSNSSDPNCCRNQVSQPVCSPFDPGGGCGGVSTPRCEECETGCDSCVCDKCPNEWAQCQGDAGCMAIWECIQETDCELCYTASACQDVIDENGGPMGTAMAKVAQTLNCSRLPFAMCGADCPDACLPPDCQCGDCMSRCLCQTGGATQQCELQCNGACSPELGCLCGSATIASCICNGSTKAECEATYGTACSQQTTNYTCLDNCLCNGTSLDICASEQCRNTEIHCGNSICYGREFPGAGFNWMAPPCCPSSGSDACGVDLGAMGSGLSGCAEVARPGGENTSCPSHPPVSPWTGNDLPGCCSSGVCGYLDEYFAALGCMSASNFGDVGDGC